MNEREQLAKDNGMTIEFVSWFFDNKKDGCGNAWFIMMAAMWEGWSGREAKCAALAAEREIVNADNAYLRDQIMCWARECDRITYAHTNKVTDAHQSEAEQDLANTFPASSAFLAEVRAQGVEMFANWSEKHIENDDEYEDVLTEVSRAARGFANQLRQDANTAELVAAGIITKVGE